MEKNVHDAASSICQIEKEVYSKDEKKITIDKCNLMAQFKNNGKIKLLIIVGTRPEMVRQAHHKSLAA